MSKQKARITLVSIACALALALPSCASGDESKESTTTTAAPPAQQTEAATTEASDVQDQLDATDYYEAVIAALEAKLLEEKQDRYISEYEYDQKLRELEDQLTALKNQASNKTDKPSADTDAPTENLGAEETDTPPEHAPVYEGEKMSFRYGIVNGTVTIYEYLGGTTTVAIPSTLNGYRVTAIADYAFAGSDVTAVVIPPSVVSIGWFAFNGCASLSSVSIPASVTSIGYAAFDGCDGVTVLCVANSYAREYAASFGMSYQVI